MSKEKQIEEMAKDIAEAIKHNSAVDVIRHGLICVNSDGVTRELYDAGYRKQSEWISVEERLPECRFVIVCDEYGNVGEAWFCKANKRFEWVTDDERVFATHWIPLPEAPKMKGGEEE